ncbi:MAG: PAS domain S-box protein [Cyanobacteria bacterium SZAS-4]|nr:PAS domain S-box protein [Cyanobacteria bacterium SZAS-4]
MVSEKESYKFDLNVFQMGLVLVGVPLLFEIIFVVSLFVLYKHAEAKTLEVAHARDVRAVADRVLNGYAAASMALLEFSFRRDNNSRMEFKHYRDHSENNLKRLKDIVHDDKKQSEIVKITESNGAYLSQALDRMFEMLTNLPDNSVMDPVVMMELGQERSKIMNYLMITSRQIANFSNKLDRESEDLMGIEAGSRKFYQFVLILGMLVNIVVALGLAMFFADRILRRINTVKDNTLRLATGKDLNPVLIGTDEIAELDNGFHRMARALNEAQRKEKAIVDSAPDVICSINSDGRFIRVNPASKELWGYAPEELVGMRFNEIIVPEDLQKVTQFLDNIREDQDPGTIECRIAHKKGHDAHMIWAVRWSPLDQALFCVVHDISERKELEQLKQHFMAMVSHDLRTPLNSVKNFLGMLNTPIYGTLSEKGGLRKGAVEQEIDRLNRLIDDLLDLEKLEAGKMELELKPTRIQSVALLAFESVRGVAEKKNIEIILPKTEIEVNMDGERIIQVLVNLLSNSVKFSPEGSQVTVSFDTSKTHAKISVKDSGSGLPEGSEKTLFSRFKQFAKGPGAPKGSGLGLAICKEIVTAHQGTIGCISEPGKGATFWFEIPLDLHTDL